MLDADWEDSEASGANVSVIPVGYAFFNFFIPGIFDANILIIFEGDMKNVGLIRHWYGKFIDDILDALAVTKSRAHILATFIFQA